MNSRDVVLLPYLCLRHRLAMGPWEVIPRSKLTREDATTQRVFELLPKYLDLYAIPKNQPRDEWGCLVKKRSASFGDFVERSELGPVHHAVLVGVLACNPPAGTMNPGRTLSTSESCLMFGHPISEEGRVSVENGAMFHEVVVAGLRLGADDGYVSHPTSLCTPRDGSQVDDALAVATLDALTANTEGARRLLIAIDWLQTVWMNSEAVSWDVRVMALKAAFETVLDKGDKVGPQRTELSALLDPSTAARQRRGYLDLSGKPALTPPLTELQWWFTKLTFLRNSLAHGSQVASEDYLFEGESHVMIAQSRLLEVIRKLVTL